MTATSLMFAPDAIGRAAWYDVWGVRARVLDADSLFDHKLAILAGATEDRPVDRKHYHDAVRLGHLCGRQVGDWPSNVFRSDEYSTNRAARCARCNSSLDAAFPLAPKQSILDILGYC